MGGFLGSWGLALLFLFFSFFFFRLCLGVLRLAEVCVGPWYLGTPYMILVVD